MHPPFAAQPLRRAPLPRRRAISFLFASVHCLGVAAVTRSALPQAGSFDDTYAGGTGVATLPFANNLWLNGVVQSDGRVVAVGRQNPNTTTSNPWKWVIARYHADGSLDPTFNASRTPGYHVLFGTLNFDQACDVALDASQRIYVVGNVSSAFGKTVQSDLGIVRLTTAGDLDGTFGSGGVLTVDFAGNAKRRVHDFGRAIVMLGGGQFLVAGFTYGSATTGYDAFLAKLNGDGSLDKQGFGAGKGYIVHSWSKGEDEVKAMRVDSAGRIVVGGWSATSEWTLVRYSSTGVHDSSFGPVSLDLPGVTSEKMWGFAIQPWDDAIVSFGRHYDPNVALFQSVVVRMTASGALDASFHNGLGFVHSDDQSHEQGTGQGYVMPDGRLVIAAGRGDDSVVRRYLASGAPDATFGDQGLSEASPGGIRSFSGSTVPTFILPDGRGGILTGGYTYPSGQTPRCAIFRHDS